jgi:zinc protease
MSRPTSLVASVLAVAALGCVFGAPAAAHEPQVSVPVANAPIELVTLPSPSSPLVAVSAFFRVGSMDDPEGKEGLASLAASVVGEGATTKRPFKDLVEALYPLAASISVRSDREVTVFSAEVHRDKLDELTALFTEVLLQPAFAEADFTRHKSQAQSYLTTSLRAASDEMLGLELIQQEIYAGHPYEHSPAGTVAGLSAITLDDVKAFWRERFTTGNLTLGVAGGYPEGYPEKLAAALAGLPAGPRRERPLPPAPQPPGREVTLVEKGAASVGIHIGYPLSIGRADADFYPLMVANSFLGEHRTFHGRLQQELRSERGLNYGNYSYIEHYFAPPQTSNPTPNVPRRQQYFSIWVRPVQPAAASFATRAALHQVQRLVKDGMTEDEFDSTRDFLVNYSKLWAQTLSRRLGFLLDSKYYGTPYFIDEVERRLGALTAAEVNAALRRHLQTDRWEAVMITGDAAGLEKKLREAEPPMAYTSPVGEATKAEDPAILAVTIDPTKVEIVPVAQVFER